MAYKTPGVYVKEVSVFPPSVAEVATAIPAFIGYTEKAVKRGEDLTNVPTRISSLLEYRELFGGEFEIPSVAVQVDRGNNFSVTSLTMNNRFYMFESLRLFFDNGGGACYIVSVGPYQIGSTMTTVTSNALGGGIRRVRKVDEPTILLFPDATLLSDEGQFATLQQTALAQCGDLQDRVAVFDLKENVANRDHRDAVTQFRNRIGINNLKYGMAYTPWLYTTYEKTVPFNIFSGTVTDETSAAVPLDTLSSSSDINGLVTATNTTISDQTVLANAITALNAASPTLKDEFARLRNLVLGTDDAGAPAAFTALVGFVNSVAVSIPTWRTLLRGPNLLLDLNAYAVDKLRSAVEALIAFDKNDDVQEAQGQAVDDGPVSTFFAPYDVTGWLSDTAANISETTATDYGDPSTAAHATAVAATTALEGIFDGINNFIADIVDAANTHVGLTQQTLYKDHAVIGNIVETIKREFSKVPPSGAVVGRYAFVDRTRGVWKAPANVSLSAVRAPVENIDFFEQEDLNVDSVGGKSVNAIRSFAGRGAAIIWGARTLAGNDNEWRYVPVRRFFNMVEESVKNSTAWAVFEPNAAPLWARVKGMIDNYLIQKWREGALQGAVPEDAFFVKIGLGQTMTAQDILEGRLIVEIGMAVVRPAEFIILRFMHKLPVS